MQKFLRTALIGSITFLVLNHLIVFVFSVLMPLLSEFAGIETYGWFRVKMESQQVMIIVTNIFFLLSAIALIMNNKRSALACIGGGLMGVYGLSVVVRNVLRYVYMLCGFEALNNAEYNTLIYIVQIVLWCTALVLVALHYKNKAMLWLGIVMIILEIVTQTTWFLFLHEPTSYMGYYSMAAAVSGFALFVIELIYLVIWLRYTTPKSIDKSHK